MNLQKNILDGVYHVILQDCSTPHWYLMTTYFFSYQFTKIIFQICEYTVEQGGQQ